MEAPVNIEANRPYLRATVILTLAVCGALGGFLISYLFPPRYTAASTVVAEDHLLVIPAVTVHFAEIVHGFGEFISDSSRLSPVIRALNLGKPEDEDKVISEIQQHTQVEPVITTAKKEGYTSNQPVLGLNVEYTDRNAVRAQRICSALTSLIVDENVRFGADPGDTTDFFFSQVIKVAKDDLEHKRAQLRAIRKSPSPRSLKQEATYNALALDYVKTQAYYKLLLAKADTSERYIGTRPPPLGEHVRIDTADIPVAPSFPNRPLFSLCGLGAGLLLAVGRLLWFTEGILLPQRTH